MYYLVGFSGFKGSFMNWPFPQHPPIPWTAKQINEYQQAQRQQTEDALL
jgi:hypothetical protein